jgi:hypothetical protein
MDVMGRIEDGTWLLVAFSPPSYSDTDPCWMEAKYLDVSEAEVMSVEPVDPDIYLPIESYYPAPSSWPTLDSVIRKDDKTVIVSWFFYDVPLGDRESETSPRYLIEAWVCEAGKIVFRPTGWYGSIASITDETGCTEPSHARLYLAWKHGYAGPVEVKPWPQSQTVLSTPTLTPTP